MALARFRFTGCYPGWRSFRRGTRDLFAALEPVGHQKANSDAVVFVVVVDQVFTITVIPLQHPAQASYHQ